MKQNYTTALASATALQKLGHATGQ